MLETNSVAAAQQDGPLDCIPELTQVPGHSWPVSQLAASAVSSGGAAESLAAASSMKRRANGSISDRRSRRGGTLRTRRPAERKRSCLKVPRAISTSRFRFVAAMKRTSTCLASQAADPKELLLFNRAQELGLRRQRELRDLVEKNGPAIGHLDSPRLLVIAPLKSPFHGRRAHSPPTIR